MLFQRCFPTSIVAVRCHLVDIVFWRCGVLLLCLTWCFVCRFVRPMFSDVFISLVFRVVVSLVFVLFWRLEGDANIYLKHWKKSVNFKWILLSGQISRFNRHSAAGFSTPGKRADTKFNCNVWSQRFHSKGGFVWLGRNLVNALKSVITNIGILFPQKICPNYQSLKAWLKLLLHTC